ncbi:MAG TPA: class I SAM-dependent methyltransferase [Mycobacteriales bacterium]|nr:class I SAM-dependent methyltransferase [Mycobacteriales bacterium]
MSFEEVMGTVMPWTVATEARAALGAQLALEETGGGDPAVAAALQGVTEAAGLDALADLCPQQRAGLVGVIRSTLRQAVELLDDPERAPGWCYADPDVLDGWGRGSAMVPTMLTNIAPEIGDVTSLLDIGTGVGLLAVSATTAWPKANVVGIDVWEPSLARARANVSGAGLDDRITLRRQDLAELDDVDAYDCVWFPTFFFTAEHVAKAMDAVARATRPGGWIVLGRLLPAPNPLGAATLALRTIRSGGENLPAERTAALLREAGCIDVREVPAPAPVPMSFTVGRRPS